MHKPIVSMVMPVYNRAEYLKKSIQSILNQTFKDFEFIIVNDGSADNSIDIIKSFNDPRIKIFENDKNRGIVYSRNRGLSEAKGEFISMFDSDDIAVPNKLEIQLDFLKNNPDFAMVGSWVRWIDEHNNFLKNKWKLTAKPEKIPAIMLFRNYFVQSTVVIRKNAIPDGKYSEGFDIVEDSKMWFDVALKHKVANIQKYLVYYRVHSGNISDLNPKHFENSKKLFRYIFKMLDIEPTDEELNIHYLIKNDKKINDIEQLKKVENWLIKIAEANESKVLFDRKILRMVIFNRWLKVLNKSKKTGFGIFKTTLKSPLSRYFV